MSPGPKKGAVSQLYGCQLHAGEPKCLHVDGAQPQNARRGSTPKSYPTWRGLGMPTSFESLPNELSMDRWKTSITIKP
eukprot:4931863-Alexandrium_andersonii.AAC.1